MSTYMQDKYRETQRSGDRFKQQPNEDSWNNHKRAIHDFLDASERRINFILSEIEAVEA